MEVVHALYRTQRNIVFKEIVKAGLEPSLFRLYSEEEEGVVYYCLNVVNDNYFYRFHLTHDGSPYSCYYPSERDS